MKFLEVDGLGQVSRVGLGTWQFGSREWGYGAGYASGAARDIVRRARELGVTLFDTAEVYGFGKSEQILGDALGADRDEERAEIRHPAGRAEPPVHHPEADQSDPAGAVEHVRSRHHCVSKVWRSGRGVVAVIGSDTMSDQHDAGRAPAPPRSRPPRSRYTHDSLGEVLALADELLSAPGVIRLRPG